MILISVQQSTPNLFSLVPGETKSGSMQPFET